MATNLNLEGSSFTPVTAEIRLRANTSDGMPLKHDDVDSNFENLRLAHNDLVSDLDDHIGSSSSSDHPIASTASHGFMSSTHVTKLNGIAESANNYSLPTASDSTKGGIKTGYVQTGRNYPVKIDPAHDGVAYVTIPWTDTAYTLPTASGTTTGGIKIGYSASGKNYPVQLDGSNKAYVNVPWTDTDTVLSEANVKNLVASGFTLNDNASIKLYDDTSAGNNDCSIYAKSEEAVLDAGWNALKLKGSSTTDANQVRYPLYISRGGYHDAYVLTTDNADKRTLAFGDWWASYSNTSEYILDWMPSLKMARLGNTGDQNGGVVSGAIKVIPGRRYRVGIHLDTNTNTNNVLDIAFLKTNDQLLLNESNWLADYVGDASSNQQDAAGGITRHDSGRVTTEWHYNLDPGSTLKYYEFDVQMEDDTEWFSVMLKINNTRSYILYFDPSIDVTLEPESGKGQGELTFTTVSNASHGTTSTWQNTKLYYLFHKEGRLVHLDWTFDPNGSYVGLNADGYVRWSGLPFAASGEYFLSGPSKRSTGGWAEGTSGTNSLDKCTIIHSMGVLQVDNQVATIPSSYVPWYGSLTYTTDE